MTIHTTLLESFLVNYHRHSSAHLSGSMGWLSDMSEKQMCRHNPITRVHVSGYLTSTGCVDCLFPSSHQARLGRSLGLGVVAAVEAVAASELPHHWNVVINCAGIVVLSRPCWYVDNTSRLLLWWPRAHVVVYGCRVCVSWHSIYGRLWCGKIHTSTGMHAFVNTKLLYETHLDYLRKFSESKMYWQQRNDVWG